MKTGDDDNSIAIFDSTQIFDAQVDQSELSTNARYSIIPWILLLEGIATKYGYIWEQVIMKIQI